MASPNSTTRIMTASRTWTSFRLPPWLQLKWMQLPARSHSFCSRSRQDSHRLQKQLHWGLPPSEEAPTGVAVLLRVPILTRPFFLIDRPTCYPSRCGQRLCAPPKANMQPVVRLQPLFLSSFVHGWAPTKEPAADMYQTASPPLTADPFQVPDPFEDAPETSIAVLGRVRSSR